MIFAHEINNCTIFKEVWKKTILVSNFSLKNSMSHKHYYSFLSRQAAEETCLNVSLLNEDLIWLVQSGKCNINSQFRQEKNKKNVEKRLKDMFLGKLEIWCQLHLLLKGVYVFK